MEWIKLPTVWVSSVWLLRLVLKGNTRMGMIGVSIRLVPNRSLLSLSNSRQLPRVSIGCLCMLCCRFSPPYLCRREPPNSSLAVYWPQYWRSYFSLRPLSAPLLFSRYKFDVVSRVTLPTWPGQGYGRHWLFFRALSPICILSVVGRSIIFKVFWIFVYYICILDSWSRYCIYIYIYSVGSIVD